MRRTELQCLLEIWKSRLGLDLWQIELSPEKPNPDAFMSVERQTSYQRALIRYHAWLLGPNPQPPADEEDWVRMEITDEGIECTLVHELLHLPTVGMFSIVCDDLNGFVHRDVHTQLLNGYKREEERFIDALATSLVRGFRTA